MKKYDHKKIEKRRQKYWEKNEVYKTKEGGGKSKYYVLDMFPYPSGVGLHVGHPKGYIATDVVARMKMMQGYNVLHPMGWDAFGLPAENYALKNKVHPAKAIAKNIETFKKQLGLLGLTYDWDREVNTTDPQYYKWTQWAFIQMFKHGLAFESYEPINWCPECKTGLANEDLEEGMCERCGSQVEQKPMRQWVLKITDYAERLLKDLDQLRGWPESIKTMQREWIGKSEGVNFKHRVKDLGIEFEVYDSVPQTFLAQTFVVIAPEHPLIEKLVKGTNREKEVMDFVEKIKAKKISKKFDVGKDIEGIFTGRYSENYVGTGRDLPIWVASFALMDYGTGIVGCSAHDERDFAFAKKYNIPLKPVLFPADEETAKRVRSTEFFYRESNGILEEPLDFKGMTWEQAREPVIEYIIKKGWGRTKVNYKIRDWVFSRQRYWGEPIPLVHCERCEKKKPKILLIHGLYGHSRENWFPWFKQEMESRGFEVLIPDMANAERPTLKEWVDQLSGLGLIPEDEIYVVGHSLGGPAACQFILKNNLIVKKLILVAPTGKSQGATNWNNLLKAGCDEESIECIKLFNKQNVGLDKLKNLVDKRVVYLSDDDPYIPITVREDYSVLEASVKVFKNRGHFGEGAGVIEFPDIIEEFPQNLNLGWVPVPENELPLELPKVKNYEPSGTGESPLVNITDWVNTKCPVCGGPAKRETNTMPQWAGSCWYYLRYIDPHNGDVLVNKEKEKYWSPVDLYVGGAEHATRHLIYARFWHKFLYDIGAVNYSEPFTRLQNVGLILAEDGRKMSKRWGNVINPNDVVAEFGADAMRLYEMFMGPFDQPCAWSKQGLVGMKRFLEKVWLLPEKVDDNIKVDLKLTVLLHQTIKKVTEDIEALRFNTAVAQLMIFVNELVKTKSINKGVYLILIKLLSPFAPFLADELFVQLNDKTVFESDWPEYDVGLIKNETMILAVQINGKLRDTLEVVADISEENAKQAALNSENIKKWLEGREPKKIIYVKDKLVSIVL